MKVYEVRFKIFMLENIELERIQEIITNLIDSSLGKDDELLKLHKTNEFKNYCFDFPYPIEADKVYKANSIYTIRIRTISYELANHFTNNTVNEFNNEIKGLKAEIRIIPKKHIEKIYSITPLIIKNENGYWKGNITLDEFERRLRENLIKKYNTFNSTKIDEDFELYSGIEFKNNKPIATKYKSIRLLGDKVSLNIAENEEAQELAYMVLGTGIGEVNARGYGFVNFRWL
ncbi:MAG: CRISPR-associated endoribonuclease Cas6 [Clostridium sp.]